MDTGNSVSMILAATLNHKEKTMQLFTEQENREFRELKEGLDDGNHIVEIKKVKVIKIKTGRNLILEFMEPESQIIKTLFLSMEKPNLQYLKAFLIKVGLSPDMDLNHVEEKCQELVGRDAEISLVTKISDSGKRYQNIYLNRLLMEKEAITGGEDGLDF